MSKKVTLTNDHPKVSDRSYDIDHATRILKRGNTGGWKLPENSKFTFDKVTNAIIEKPSTGAVKAAKE